MSFPRLIIKRIPSDPNCGGRCFCCRDRIDPGVSQHRAFDAEGEDCGLVCPSCASASDEKLREEMRDLAGRLMCWASDLLEMVKHPIRRDEPVDGPEQVH